LSTSSLHDDHMMNNNNSSFSILGASERYTKNPSTAASIACLVAFDGKDRGSLTLPPINIQASSRVSSGLHAAHLISCY
jgi:hypothetical protein